MSSVSLTAVAVLESPRKDARGKTITFDAQIYLGAYQPLVVEFRYFNANDISFDEVGTYIVHGTIAKWMKHQDPSVASLSSDSDQAVATTKTKTSDGSAGEFQGDSSEELVYDFVGDITWLIPANADPRYLAWVHGSGTVNKSEKDYFDMDPAQYTSALKGLKANNSTASMLPLHCIIPDSPRYKDKKPIPHVGTMVSFEGYLCSRMTNSETGKTERFHIDIDRVTFMGRSTVPPPTPDAAVTPAKRKLKFNFNDVDAVAPVSGAAKCGKAASGKPVGSAS